MPVVGSGVLSSLGTTGTTQLTDKVDSPHSGLFKALHNMSQGNLAIDMGATDADGNFGFSHTYSWSSGSPSVVVQGGTILFEGKLTSVADSGSLSLTKPSSGAYYHWITVNSGGALQVSLGTSDGVVPDIPTQSIPISLVKVQSTDSSGDLATQFFTTMKQSNSVSLAYDNSEEYTEMSKITAASGGTTIEVATAGGDFTIDNTDADKKIIMRLGSDDANTDFEVRNNSDSVRLGVDGTGATTIAGALTLSTVAAAGTDTDKFLVLDSGGIVDYRTGAEVRSDIGAGTSSVAALNDLSDVSYSSGDLTITSLDKIVFANGGNAELSVAATGSGTDGRDLTIEAGSAPTGSADQSGGDLILKAGGGDGTGTSMIALYTKVSGTDATTEKVRIDGAGNVGIGTTSPSSLLEVRGPTGSSSTSAGVLTLSTAETSVADGDQLGRIDFQAPLESDGGHGVLVGSSIHAVADGAALAALQNDTALVFSTSQSFQITGCTLTNSDATVTVSDTNSIRVGMKITSGVSGFPADATVLSITNDTVFEMSANFTGSTGTGTINFFSAAENMRLNKEGRLGIGTSSPEAALHVKRQDEQVQIKLSSGDSGTTSEPIIQFHRDSPSPADGDFLGAIWFSGEDNGGNLATYSYINAEAIAVANGDEIGALRFSVLDDSTGTSASKNMLRIRGGANGASGAIEFNDDGIDCDFRIESSGDTHIFHIDGGANRIGISTGSPDSLFEIEQGSTGGLTAFKIDNDDTDQIAFAIEAANINADVIDITADAVTTANVIDITADALTSGSVINIASDSSSTNARELIKVHNDNAGATGTLPLKVINDSTGMVAHFVGDAINDMVRIESQDADGTNAPDLTLYRNSSSPIDGDEMGVINFRGRHDNTGDADYGYVSARALDVSDGSEDGVMKMGVMKDGSPITLLRVGKPNVSTNATVHSGVHTYAAVASVAAATYAPDIASSGIVILMTNASSIVTLPDVGAGDVGVQFTIINTSGGTLSGKIQSADTSNTRFNGAGSYAAQDIADDKAKTFLCVAADNWQVIG